MSYQVTIGGDGPFQLASAGGLNALATWVGTLEAPKLRELVTNGRTVGTSAVARELKDNLQRCRNSDVKHTVEMLLEKLGVGADDEDIVIHQ